MRNYHKVNNYKPVTERYQQAINNYYRNSNKLKLLTNNSKIKSVY